MVLNNGLERALIYLSIVEVAGCNNEDWWEVFQDHEESEADLWWSVDNLSWVVNHKRISAIIKNIEVLLPRAVSGLMIILECWQQGEDWLLHQILWLLVVLEIEIRSWEVTSTTSAPVIYYSSPLSPFEINTCHYCYFSDYFVWQWRGCCYDLHSQVSGVGSWCKS